jgi:hypothetical protein
VPIVVVDTDEGICGVGLGPHVHIEALFAAIDGEDPRGVTALYDRMLRQTFKAGRPCRLLGGRDRTVRAYASGPGLGPRDTTSSPSWRVARALMASCRASLRSDHRRLAALGAGRVRPA